MFQKMFKRCPYPTAFIVFRSRDFTLKNYKNAVETLLWKKGWEMRECEGDWCPHICADPQKRISQKEKEAFWEEVYQCTKSRGT